MDGTLTEDDVEHAIYEIAEEHGIELDGVQWYTEPMRKQTIFQIYKYSNAKGEREKYGAEIALDDQQLVNPNQSVDIIKRQIESLTRDMKEHLSKRMEVNGHRLRFYLGDGFHAVDEAVGEEWQISEGEIKHRVGPTPPVEEGQTFPRTHVRQADGEIPYHVKEKMMMWVIGWALQQTPQEWMRYARLT